MVDVVLFAAVDEFEAVAAAAAAVAVEVAVGTVAAVLVVEEALPEVEDVVETEAGTAVASVTTVSASAALRPSPAFASGLASQPAVNIVSPATVAVIAILVLV